MLLVLGIMLAMAPQNICRCSNSLPSGLQNSSDHGTADLAWALCSIFENFSFYARRSLQNCSSIFSTSSSENFCLSQILCSCKQDTKSLERSAHKSRDSTGGNWSLGLFRLSRFAKIQQIQHVYGRSNWGVQENVRTHGHVQSQTNKKVWHESQLVMAPLWCQEACHPQIVYQGECENLETTAEK